MVGSYERTHDAEPKTPRFVVPRSDLGAHPDGYRIEIFEEGAG
jgi:hypothetical protein